MVGWYHGPDSVRLVTNPVASCCDDLFPSTQDNSSFPFGSFLDSWEYSEVNIIPWSEDSAIPRLVVLALVLVFRLCLPHKGFRVGGCSGALFPGQIVFVPLH